MAINITQWLCPQRHAVIAYVWDTENTTEKDIVAQGEEVFKGNAIQRVCGICNGEIHVETSVTKYLDIRTATPEIFKLQLANLAMMLLQGRKRIRVRIIKTVKPDMRMLLPDAGASRTANPGEEYDADSNQNGAVSIIFPNGDKLGVKPGEFEFIEAPDWLRKLHAARWN